MEGFGWLVTLSGAGSVTLVKPAQVGKQHIIYGFDISSGFGVASIIIQIQDGGTIIWKGRCFNTLGSTREVIFLKGVSITRGNACSIIATKADGTLDVNLHGITRG